MAERTVRAVFYTWTEENEDGVPVPNTATRGEKIEVSDEEAERGDALGAFEESDVPLGAANALNEGTLGPQQGGVHTASGRFPDPKEGEAQPSETAPEVTSGIVRSDVTDQAVADDDHELTEDDVREVGEPPPPDVSQVEEEEEKPASKRSRSSGGKASQEPAA
jgi:hypothetical protein